MVTIWTKDFPKKDGFYWFYGKPWAESKEDDLFVIQVNGEKCGKIHAQTLGTFVYNRIAKGQFSKIEPPSIPANIKADGEDRTGSTIWKLECDMNADFSCLT